MKRRLDIRLAALIIGITAGILIMFTVINIITNHYHIEMYRQQSTEGHGLVQLNSHLEQAQMQSVILTCLLSIALASMIGMNVARRISAPLVQMKQAAERMTQGQLDVRVHARGQDELAELGRSLNELAVQLGKQERLRKSMTQDIAHELRTPLTTLKSHTRAMEDGIWEPTAERFRICLEEIDRLIELVTELEDLHVMESPGFRLSLSEQNVSHLLEKAVRLVKPMFIEKRVELRFEEPKPILADVDADRIHQVLMNVLSNALRHTTQGGFVCAEVKEDELSVLITVEDNGEGISSDDLPFIFERLYRGDKSRNRHKRGSGMGLAIAKRLVDAHGGDIWAESAGERRRGSRFYIRIPKRERGNLEKI